MKSKPNEQLLAIGRRIRELRKARGYSQEGFALRAGLARAYYSGVERGQRNVSALNLVKIASALDTEVGDLFPPVLGLVGGADNALKHSP